MHGRWQALRGTLGRFPLSIIQLAGRIGVGATFFKAGLLKYQSWEFTVKLFQDEYRVPLLDPAVAARIAVLQELTDSDPAIPGTGHADRHAAVAGHDSRDPDVRLSKRV